MTKDSVREGGEEGAVVRDINFKIKYHDLGTDSNWQCMYVYFKTNIYTHVKAMPV